MNLTTDDLLNIGFIQVGTWEIKGGVFNYFIEQSYEGLIRINNALYAFTLENQVKYIGKTTKSIKKRFVGYVKPGNSQATNAKCNNQIQSLIKDGKRVEIWAFTPSIPFQILNFDLNIAAGLEDSLIEKFNPEWNGKKSASDVSDLVEYSDENDTNNEILHNNFDNPTCRFNILLGQTYYNSGFINPGVEASKNLDKDGADIKVILGSSDNVIHSNINRTANKNGTVRVIGNNNQISRWFQQNFKLGDVITADVIDQKTIFLRKTIS